MDEHFLTIAELAAKMRISPRTVIRRLESGLPHYKEGRRLLFLWAEVLAWMDQRRILTTDQTDKYIDRIAAKLGI